MPTAAIPSRLAYAEPGVRTAPPRTLFRVVGRWLWNVARLTIRLIQMTLLGLAYVVLGAAFLIRVVLVAVAVPLMLLGRLHWDGRAVRVWVVRTFNRAWIASSGPFRRHRESVPLATPNARG